MRWWIGLWGCVLVPAVWAAAGAADPWERSAALSEWKQQIEARGGRPVYLVRVSQDKQKNQISLPEDAPQQAVLRRYLSDASFASSLVRAHALSLNYAGKEGKFHFILLNLGTREQWSDYEEALVAHELGHLWLFAQNYPVLSFGAGEEGCLSTNASDMVQHVLIRQELENRKISYRPFWMRNLKVAQAELEQMSTASSLPRCQRWTLLESWVDVGLGLSAESWEGHAGFLDLLAAKAPGLRETAEEITESLRENDLRDRQVYTEALVWTRQQLQKIP